MPGNHICTIRIIQSPVVIPIAFFVGVFRVVIPQFWHTGAENTFNIARGAQEVLPPAFGVKEDGFGMETLRIIPLLPLPSLNAFKLSQVLFFEYIKGFHFSSWKRFGGWEIQLQVVDLLAVFPKAEANVGAGSQPRGAHITNDLALADSDTWANALGKTLHVQILGFVGAIVADFYKVAVARSKRSL